MGIRFTVNSGAGMEIPVKGKNIVKCQKKFMENGTRYRDDLYKNKAKLDFCPRPLTFNIFFKDLQVNVQLKS